jgi:uncharacterized protein (DUF362 family)
MANSAANDRIYSDLSTYYHDLRVAVYRGGNFYLNVSPFNPHLLYPEHVFPGEISDIINPAYDAIRNCFHLLGMDHKNFGSPNWNPLRDLIQPGDKVVLKPNFVLSSHSEGGNLFSIITHPSIIRALIDYVFTALRGEGEIIVADAPQMDCNFRKLLEETGLPSIQELYWKNKQFDIKILDLRDFWLDLGANKTGAYVGPRRKLVGDNLGSIVIDLGRRSEFYARTNSEDYYGADYNREETRRHHSGEVQQYMVSKTILSADVVIMIPKLKVHKKVGVTLGGKGLVGINTNKNYLIHYTLGTPSSGGDQFPDKILDCRENLILKTQRALSDLLLARRNRMLDAIYIGLLEIYKKLLKRMIGTVDGKKAMLDSGNWCGNDSAWRMVSDLMKIIMYAGRDGNLNDSPQRRIFTVIDGIIGGEGNGPLAPTEKRSGVVIAGLNPLATDIVGSRMMGFDWQKLRYITNLLENEHFEFYIEDVKRIEVLSNIPEWNNIFEGNEKLLGFVPHPGWVGHIEIT